MRRDRFLSGLVPVVLSLLVACGSPPPTGSTVDSGVPGDVSSFDVDPASDTTSDTVSDAGTDAATDAGADVATDGSTDAADVIGDIVPDADCETLGCPCEADADCDSGYCVDDPESGGRVCSALCDETCEDEGFECRTLVNSEGDAVRLCVPVGDTWCDPCEAPADCGSLDAACYPLDDDEPVCLTPCDADTLCPEGASCTALTTGDGDGRFCVPDAGLCRGCLDLDEDLHGQGPDCLGPDEDDLDPTVYEGAPELCDGLDNDGNDEIDEGFDLSSDPAHCGECGNACIVAEGVGVCVDGVCAVDACPEGFADCDEDFDTGCETDLTDPARCGTCLVPEGVPGEACGVCGTGSWVCGDDGDTTCEEAAGDEVLNACGGCGPLDAEPGTPCGTCDSGVWACDGEEAVVCEGDAGDDALNGCGGCSALEDGPGDACGSCGLDEFVCDGMDATVCSGDTAGNACGGCDVLEDAPGDSCGACGLDAFICVTAESTVCDGDTTINACGGCSDLAGEPGSACGRCGLDTYACDGEEAVVCSGDTAGNACGGCGDLDGVLGAPCGPCGLDALVCDGEDGLVCDGATECPEPTCFLAGELSTRTITLAESPCIVTGDVTIPVGETLTVEPGVVFKFHVSRTEANDRDFIVEGTLNAEGTADLPIRFTSFYDDDVLGDTNADGVTTTPLPGDWGEVHFTSTGAGTLRHAEIWYGGGGNTRSGSCCSNRAGTASLVVRSPIAPTLANLLVSQSQTRGAYLNSTSGFPSSISTSIFVDNRGLGLEVLGGPALFTATAIELRDNGGDGGRVTTTGDVTLEGFVVDGNATNGLVVDTPGLLRLTNSEFDDHPGNINLVITDAEPGSQVRGNTITASDSFIPGTLEVSASVVPDVVQEVVDFNTLSNMARGLYVRPGQLNVDATWASDGFEYVVGPQSGDVTIAEDASLVLEPGVVLKWNVSRTEANDGDLIVNGTLTAEGTAEEPIVLTSLYDDALGGDTNGDGVTTTPRRGDWGEVRFTETGTGSLDYVEIHYGGGGNTRSGQCCNNRAGTAGLVVQSAIVPTMQNLLVRESQAGGFRANVSTGTAWGIADSAFVDNGTQGVEINGSAASVTLTSLVVEGNGGTGVRVSTVGPQTLTGLTVQDNGTHGVWLDTSGLVTLRSSEIADHADGYGVLVAEASVSSVIADNVIESADIVASVIPDLVDDVIDANTLRDTERGLHVRPGTLRADATWDDIGITYVPNIPAGDLTVGAGSTLTLAPGVVVKFGVSRGEANDGDILVDGTLLAAGTADAPIVFTAHTDDTVGGDTNGDGVSTVGVRGDWGSIIFRGDAGGELSNAAVRFGGGGNTRSGSCCSNRAGTAALVVQSSEAPVMHDLVVSDSQSRGAYFAPTGGLAWALENARFTESGQNGVELASGAGLATLDTVEIQASGGFGLDVASLGDLTIVDSTIEGSGNHGVRIDIDGTLSLTGTDILDHPESYGLILVDADVESTIIGNTISGAGVVASVMPDLVEEVVSRNTLADMIRGVHVRPGDLTVDTTWPDIGVPYVMNIPSGDVTITESGQLNLQAGVLVKFGVSRGESNDGDLIVNGRLTVGGTVDEPVILTSHADDTGGDTNDDGVSTVPVAGDWGGVVINATASFIAYHTEFRFGGGGNTRGCCSNRAGPATLVANDPRAFIVRDCSVTSGQADGIQVNGGTGSVLTSSISNNRGHAIDVASPVACVTWTFADNTYTDNVASNTVNGCP